MISQTVVKAIERGAGKVAKSEIAGSDAVVSALESGLSDVVSAVESAASDVVRAIEKSGTKSGGGGGVSFGATMGSMTQPPSYEVRKNGKKQKTIKPQGKSPTAGMVASSTALIAVWSTIIGKTKVLRKKTKQLGGVMNKTAKIVGKSVAPAFTLVVDGIITLFEGFNKLPGPVQSFISMAFALVSALTILTTTYMAVSAGASAAATSLGIANASLMATLGPVLAIVAALALLYTAWKTNFLGIRTVTKQVVKWIRKQVAKFVAFVRPLWQRFVTGLRKLWKVHGSALVKELRATMAFLVKGIRRFVAVTKPIWKTGLRILTAVAKAAFAFIKTYVLTVIDGLVTGVRAGLALLRGDWKQAGKIILGFVKRAGKRIKKLAKRVEKIFGGLAKSAKRWGKDLIAEFVSGIDAKIQHFKQKINDLKNTVQDAISFDRVENDRMAQRWGSDLVDHFARGMSRKSGQLQTALPSQQPGSFGLQPTSSTGSRTTVNVTVEAGAVQMRGGSTARVNAEKTAEGVANEFAQRFGRRS